MSHAEGMEALFLALEGPLLCYALRLMNDHEMAQDVVQETMISVSKAIPGFKYDPAKGSFKSWLANITRWRITDQFRKRLGLEPEEAASHVPDRDTFTARWDTEWEKNLVSAAIARARPQRASPPPGRR